MITRRKISLKMSKEDDKKPPVNQWAWILNYQPKIEHQHIHMGDKSADVQPETKADEEKRKRLMATNTVIRTHTQSGKPTTDIMKLYNFIDKYFAGEISHKYEWYALRRFLEKHRLLRECNNEEFAAQMNHADWFAHAEKKCQAKDYRFTNFSLPIH